MAHTPGPWTIVGDCIVGADGVIVVYEPNEYPADRLLIAAAPDLLVALRDILNVIEADDLIPESVSYIRQARAAMSKAVA